MREVPLQPFQPTQTMLETMARAHHRECLLCGTKNPAGFGLKFVVESNGVVAASFDCPEELRSYPMTLHGGVVSALLDAAMTNALFSVGLAGVTAELTVRFLSRVGLNQEAKIGGSLERITPRLVWTKGEIEQEAMVVARASAKFFVTSRFESGAGG